jgi:anti-anti-sigma regulatory factor/transcriptional regulator with GAF, ATPase, and Fis domain
MPDTTRLHRVRQQTLTATAFAEIVNELVNDFDVIEVLTTLTARCVELLPAAAAGILLADSTGRLRVVGASSETIQLLELFQLQTEQGPCLDCYNTGEAIAAPDLTTESAWPNFGAASVAAGYPAVYAIPLHRNTVRLGCLNLFMTDTGLLAPTDVALAQALADVASIAIVQGHANLQTDDRDSHLNHALDSRIAIEQAKGMLAEHFTVDVHDAFEMLRAHARRTASGLTATADQLVAGTITVDAFEPPQLEPDPSELTVKTTVAGNRRTVRITGDLELATRNDCFNACVNGDGDIVDIDISAITFMNCSGYSALVAARLVVEQRGGSLNICNPTGQPAYFLGLLARIESLAPADDTAQDYS